MFKFSFIARNKPSTFNECPRNSSAMFLLLYSLLLRKKKRSSNSNSVRPQNVLCYCQGCWFTAARKTKHGFSRFISGRSRGFRGFSRVGPRGFHISRFGLGHSEPTRPRPDLREVTRPVKFPANVVPDFLKFDLNYLILEAIFCPRSFGRNFFHTLVLAAAKNMLL